ncbi:MAG TPA: hypothetical protein VKU85_14340 [bacterium]|nr:hypothetical protein [bacterium]
MLAAGLRPLNVLRAWTPLSSVSAVAGTAALGVALFPTGAPEPLVAPPWWHHWVRVLHYVSAVTLFLCFILFAGWSLWAASALITQGPIFVPESIAIMAFAVSWLTKGKAYRLLPGVPSEGGGR